MLPEIQFNLTCVRKKVRGPYSWQVIDSSVSLYRFTNTGVQTVEVLSKAAVLSL